MVKELSNNNLPIDREIIPEQQKPEWTGRAIIESLREELPNLAKYLIKRSQNLDEAKNKSFYDNPDDPLEHQSDWHQWGVIAHTKEFEKVYRGETQKYLAKWGIKDLVDVQMSEKIDGLTKNDLFGIAIIFHDLGKFMTRDLKRPKKYFRHEIASGRLIKTPGFSNELIKRYNLTKPQIEYIAHCTSLHYELGKVRVGAQMEKNIEYNLDFVESKLFSKLAEEIKIEHPDLQLEIGLLFLADSLAKTDIRITNGESDAEIKAQLEHKGLDPRLIKAVKQLPVNCAVAERYLKIWARKAANPDKN